MDTANIIDGQRKSNILLSKVPQITIFFWIIKVLCTTVGETFSDYLSVNLGFGLGVTSAVMGAALAVVLFFQVRAKKYIPVIYWLTVVLISVFGTLVTDIGTDQIGIPLEASTIFFTVLLLATFAVWYRYEKTLSIHSIFTRRREGFYWLAIFFTFALGTASGDLISEGLGFGYLTTGLIVCGVIICAAVAWKLGLDSVLSFWIIYIMARPLGASIGDFLSQPHENGGLGLGATITSIIFLSAILITVVFLIISKIDLIQKPETTGTKTVAKSKTSHISRTGIQVIAVLCIFLVVSVPGYFWREAYLTSEASSSTGGGRNLWDMSQFITIEQDMLTLVQNGDLSGAKTRADDLETAWDDNAARLQHVNRTKWDGIDGSIDDVLNAVRAKSPNADDCTAALQASLTLLQN